METRVAHENHMHIEERQDWSPENGGDERVIIEWCVVDCEGDLGALTISNYFILIHKQSLLLTNN